MEPWAAELTSAHMDFLKYSSLMSVAECAGLAVQVGSTVQGAD